MPRRRHEDASQQNAASAAAPGDAAAHGRRRPPRRRRPDDAGALVGDEGSATLLAAAELRPARTIAGWSTRGVEATGAPRVDPRGEIGVGAAFTRPGRARGREPLSATAIVTAAVRLLDVEGAAGLTFRRLAQELGVGVASLYWHVDGKDILLDLALDRVLGEVAIEAAAEAASWGAALRACGRALRRCLAEHPWAAGQLLRSGDRGPNLLRLWEFIGEIFTDAGFTLGQAFGGLSLLMNHVLASGMQEALWAGGPDAEAQRQQRMRELGEAMSALDPVQYPVIAGSVTMFVEHDQEQQFGDGLDLIIGGLERQLED